MASRPLCRPVAVFYLLFLVFRVVMFADGDPQLEKTSGRLATAIIGTLFVLCAAWIFYEVPRTNIGGLICGGVIFLVGVEVLIAAVKGRPSLLSRIGPLP